MEVVFTGRRKKAAYITSVLLVAILIFIYAGRGMLAENPFERSRSFEGPSQAVTGTDGALLVTDGGKTRVSVLTGYEVGATITGMKDSGGFFYAEHSAAGNGKVYIADVKYAEGSTRVEAERILQFTDKGRFEKVLFECVYEDGMPLQYGNVMDISFHDGALTFLLKTDDALELYSLAEGTPSLLREVSVKDAPYLCGAAYDAFSDKVYAVGKNGLIYAEDRPEGLAVISDLGDTGGVPWKIAADSSGYVYVTNLAENGVRLSSGFYETGGIVYRLDVSDGDILSFTDNESVYQIKADGTTLFSGSEARYDAAYFVLRLAVWLLAAAAGLTLLVSAIRALIWFMGNNRGARTKTLFVIIASMILTALIVAVNIIGSTLENSAKRNEYTLTQMALSVSNLSNGAIGDDLEAINSLGDYGGQEFTRLHGTLDPICLSAGEQGEYLYFVLYKVVGGKLIGVMDYEDTVGVVYPLGNCPDVYNDILGGSIPYLYESGSDAYGSWTYAVAPVYNSQGDAVGLIEMGSNLDVETLRTRRQIQDVVLSTAVLLVLFLLIFTEAAALMECFADKLSVRAGHVPEFIRPLTFLAFLADSTSVAFIPQLSERIYLSSGLNFPQSIGAALPLSVNLLMIAIAAIISGALIGRYGMKLVLIGSVVVEMAGLCLAAAAVTADSYTLLLAGMGIVGCGLGAAVVSGNTLSAAYEDEKRRNALFSGVNVGLASGIVVGTSLGSYMAQNAGYALTFAFSTAFLMPALWFGWKCAPPGFAPSLTARRGTIVEKDMNVLGFLLNKSASSFLLFLMFPFLTILYFKDFVFPLFASEQGYSEVSIGQTLLFSGALSIFIAPSASAALLRRLGAKGVNILTSALFAAALLLFTIVPTLQVSIITVYILTAVSCVGFVAQGVYFSSIRASKAFGMGKAMGVYSLFDNLAQTAGPLLFGAALVFGYRTAGLIMGFSAAALLILFALLSERDQ